MLLAQEIEKTEVLLSSEHHEEEKNEEPEVESRRIPVIANEEPIVGDASNPATGMEVQEGTSRPAQAEENVEKDKVPDDDSKKMSVEVQMPVKESLPETESVQKKIEVPDKGEKLIPAMEKKKKKKNKVHTSVLLEVVLCLEGNLVKVVTEQKVTKKVVLRRTRQLFLNQASKAELKEFREEVQGRLAGMEEQIKGLHGAVDEIKGLLKKLISSKTPASEAPEPPMRTGISKRKFEGKVPDIFWEYCAAPWEVQKKMAPEVFGFKVPNPTSSSAKAIPVIPKKKPTTTIDLDESPPAKRQKKNEK